MSESDTTALLQQLQSGQISLEACQELIQKKTTSKSQVQYKTTPKGCIGFYNVRRMPISLYVEELEQILSTVLQPNYKFSTEFQQFLDKNAAIIKRKA